MMMLLLSGITAQAQDSERPDGLDIVPESLRVRFIERLKLYVKYEREGQYGKLYDLYAKTAVKFEVPKGFSSPMQTREDYTKFRKQVYPKLIRFTPRTISRKAGCYEIRGQARLRWKSGKSEAERLIYVYLENGDWYFSTLIEEMIGTFREELIPVERTEHKGVPELRPVP